MTLIVAGSQNFRDVRKWSRADDLQHRSRSSASPPGEEAVERTRGDDPGGAPAACPEQEADRGGSDKESRDPITALCLILDRFDRIVRMDMDEADPLRDRLFQELFAAESALGNVPAALFDSERRRLAAIDMSRNHPAP